MRILVVDDLDDNRGVLRAMIESLGHEVIEAANGVEAVKKAVDHRPDLVLMDLSMPEADGLQATGALRAISHFGHSQHLPIIAITAYPQSLSKDKAEKAGCDGYLLKPASLDDLSGVLDKYLPTA